MMERTVNVRKRKCSANLVTIVNVKAVSRAHIQYDISDCQDFKRYHAELRGTTLLLYQDDTQYTVSKPLHLLFYLKFYQ